MGHVDAHRAMGNTRTHTHKQTSLHAQTSMHRQTRTHTRTHTQASSFSHTHIHKPPCTDKHAHTETHTHTQESTHTHAETHVHTRRCCPSPPTRCSSMHTHMLMTPTWCSSKHRPSRPEGPRLASWASMEDSWAACRGGAGRGAGEGGAMHDLGGGRPRLPEHIVKPYSAKSPSGGNIPQHSTAQHTYDASIHGG